MLSKGDPGPGMVYGSGGGGISGPAWRSGCWTGAGVGGQLLGGGAEDAKTYGGHSGPNSMKRHLLDKHEFLDTTSIKGLKRLDHTLTSAV